jgi:transcriptional regulator with XRE-family HTH domain
LGSWVTSPSAKVVVRVLVGARKQRGLTQRELADRVGMAPAQIAKIETGDRRLDVVEFIAIARAIGVDDRELFAAVSSQIAGNLKP